MGKHGPIEKRFLRFWFWVAVLNTTVACGMGETGQQSAPGNIHVKGAGALLKRDTRSPYEQLRSELEIPRLARLVRAYEELGATDHLMLTLDEKNQLARVAIHQRGAGTQACVLVLIHGVLSDHRAWRYVAGDLGRDHDLWLVDLPGCGDSDKPHPGKLGANGYSPTSLAARFLQGLESMLSSRPDHPQLIVAAHSLGGLVALRAFSHPELNQRYSSVLQKVQGLILISPSDVVIHQEIPTFVEVIGLNGFKARVASGLGILDGVLTQSELNTACTPTEIARETIERLKAVLTHPETRQAGQAMLRQAVPWRAKERLPDWAEMERLEAYYTNVRVPCRILWGRRDPTLPQSMGYKLCAQLPQASLKLMPGCGHSPQLCCPEACARLIREFATEVSDGRIAPQLANKEYSNDGDQAR